MTQRLAIASDHAGFDMKSIRQAVRQNAHRKRPRGASTISQQVAKNLFLWNGGGYVRKGIEAYLTVLIEHTWPKERILEVYLNVAQFGRGVVRQAGRDGIDQPAGRQLDYSHPVSHDLRHAQHSGAVDLVA